MKPKYFKRDLVFVCKYALNDPDNTFTAIAVSDDDYGKSQVDSWNKTGYHRAWVEVIEFEDDPEGE